MKIKLKITQFYSDIDIYISALYVAIFSLYILALIFKYQKRHIL